MHHGGVEERPLEVVRLVEVGGSSSGRSRHRPAARPPEQVAGELPLRPCAAVGALQRVDDVRCVAGDQPAHFGGTARGRSTVGSPSPHRHHQVLQPANDTSASRGVRRVTPARPCSVSRRRKPSALALLPARIAVVVRPSPHQARLRGVLGALRPGESQYQNRSTGLRRCGCACSRRMRA